MTHMPKNAKYFKILAHSKTGSCSRPSLVGAADAVGRRSVLWWWPPCAARENFPSGKTALSFAHAQSSSPPLQPNLSPGHARKCCAMGGAAPNDTRQLLLGCGNANGIGNTGHRSPNFQTSSARFCAKNEFRNPIGTTIHLALKRTNRDDGERGMA